MRGPESQASPRLVRRPSGSRRFPLFAVLALLTAPPLAADPGGPGSSGGPTAPAVRYGRDIRPLLSDRCFACHGPDAGDRRADLRLDLFDEAVRERDGVRAVVPGSAEESEMWARLVHPDPDERMPPPDSHKAALSEDELELVRQWIDSGAEYEPHWAFRTPERPTVPADLTEPEGEVDAFLEHTLRLRGVEAAPEERPELLLRRLYLTLTGLPPTPGELDAYLADDAPGRFEREVEKLLTEEPYVSRYAEHFATPWLDAARYADTSGIHTDAGRQIWAWRDWVLEALRTGMPFDQFLTEQLAGDLLPDATTAQKIASGFNRNHVITDEGGAIPEEYLVEYAVDRASTTGTVFLGLTMGCARCHDHKFDPLSQEEFYSFYSYFNSIDEPGLYSQLPNPERAFEPFLELPSEEQSAALDEHRARLDELQAELDVVPPGEAEERAAFFAELLERCGVRWGTSELLSAESEEGATLTVQADGSVLAEGENPARDLHRFTLETQETGLRLVSLEALTDPSLANGRVGRAPNGNAVLSSIRAIATSLNDPAQRKVLRFSWAWADVEQKNGDFRVVNALTDRRGLGWAVAGHEQEGDRAALFLTDEPFGFEGGTRLEIELDYQSVYDQHVLGRPRLRLGTLSEPGLDVLGVATSGWYATAPFQVQDGNEAFERDFGPERYSDLDTSREFDGLTFNYVPTFLDDRLNVELGGGVGATYVGKRFFVPSPRSVEVSLGSDDGFRLYVDGELRAQNQVNRGVAMDQDRATLELDAGEHFVLLKVVNTGGPSAYAWRTLRREGELAGPLLAALVPSEIEGAESGAAEGESPTAESSRARALRDAWRTELSPAYRAAKDEIATLERKVDEILEGVPRTMVMREREMRRDTYVLNRGQYDHPDETRPVERGVPSVLGDLPEGAPDDRLGLAQWLTDAEQPLVSRVAVNRLWEQVFGQGLVETSDDFGLQGSWPSHPELLDWLAVEYRESGWDTRAMLRRLVTSRAFRRSSVRPAEGGGDPDARWLSRFPRRRLGAEAIRDTALFVSGLLVEEFGGPSVKPLQPEGLWKEVAMLASNTRIYEAGSGDDLWRRSVYTYWKRACPPPSLLAFDAPTREFCTVKRPETASPLQALVLWNDETFVAAAHALAERTCAEAEGDDERLNALFRRCTSRLPDALEEETLRQALADLRASYAEGASTPEEQEAAELATWALLGTAVLSLDSTLVLG